jgi:hypothetical protein
MGVHQWIARPRHLQPAAKVHRRPLDSYGTVLVLTILDYLAVSALTNRTWGRVVIVMLFGVTLLLALSTSGVRRIWITLAFIYLLASTLLALASVALPVALDISQQTSLVGGLLLIVTPLVIARRISTHRVVTTETVLGAVCVYLLLGFSFTFVYSTISSLGSAPFFIGHSYATPNDYLFFSFTTLTTVGYGNLVPAGALGQTFAMLEALTGQIYLVIVVARLVSLWGQVRPNVESRHGRDSSHASTDDVLRDEGGHTSAETGECDTSN